MASIVETNTVSLFSWTGIERMLVVIAAIVMIFVVLTWITDAYETYYIYRKRKKAAEKARKRPINIDESP